MSTCPAPSRSSYMETVTCAPAWRLTSTSLYIYWVRSTWLWPSRAAARFKVGALLIIEICMYIVSWIFAHKNHFYFLVDTLYLYHTYCSHWFIQISIVSYLLQLPPHIVSHGIPMSAQARYLDAAKYPQTKAKAIKTSGKLSNVFLQCWAM